MRQRALLHRIAAAILLACTMGCGASDGGPIGTGISASVVGNVVDADGPVTVSIDGVPGASTSADADGSFELDGAFSGLLRLRFATQDIDETQDLVVPSGAIVALTDVQLTQSGIEVGAARQLDVFAKVESVDCGGSLLSVRELAAAGEVFSISLLPETRIEQKDGQAASCADIAPGSTVAVDGAFTPSDDLDLTALRLTLRPDRDTRHPPVRAVPFFGRALAVDCAAGSILFDDAAGPSQLSLSDATVIERPNRTPLDCTDIQVGDQLTGLGKLRLRQPGVIQAEEIVVTHRVRSDVDLRFAGRLAEIDCRTGLLQVVRRGVVLAVQLQGDTVVLPPLACDALTLRSWVNGVGRISADGSAAIDALRLRVHPPPG